MKPDSATHRQPPTLRQPNQKTDNFADIRRSPRINETSVRTQVLEAALMSTGSAMPLDGIVDGDSLIGSSLFSHRWLKTNNRNELD